MTVKGGTSQACAACKYQRRKCSADCALAPYFPPDQSKLFHSVHKLFGVSNVLKVLKHIRPDHHPLAMHSIIHHARIRHAYPVHGCYGVIRGLQHRIEQTLLELQFVKTQIAICKQQQLGLRGYSECDVVVGDQSGENLVGGFVESKENVVVVDPASWVQVQQGGCYDDIDESSVVVDPQLVDHVQKTMDGCDYVDEMHEFFQTVDEDRQSSYIGKQEVYESSSDSSSKDGKVAVDEAVKAVGVAENELRSAAACFSLTSVH